MKRYNKQIAIVFATLLIMFSACEEKQNKLGDLVTPTEVDVTFEIVGMDADNPYGDGSGEVKFIATADNYITFNFIFGDGQDNAIKQNGIVSHIFTKNGVNTYNVTVMAVGTGGITSSITVPVEVYSSFTDPEAVEFLTGGTAKTWYWAADQPGNIGLGPNDKAYPGNEHTFAYWFSSNPWHADKLCMYDAEFVFTKTDGGLTFEQTKGQAYIPGTYAEKIGVEGNVCHGSDVADPSGVKNVTMIPSSSIATVDGGYRGTTFVLSDGGFMSFYAGVSKYEIIKLTNDVLEVRVEEDGTNAWYQKFSTKNPNAKAELDTVFTKLEWADEFDANGAVDATSWTYDLGAGGWGNGEVQTYTNDAANSSIADGILKITAKKEGASYTSARINTKGKFDFKYGRVDVRAKLPVGGGTWPAIWMLGANQDAVGWPACGEIDIMEGIGNNPGFVQGALHTPSSNGDTQNKGNTTVADASSEFHVYSMNWSANQISFLVDGEIFYTYNPEVKDGDTWPFDANQFLILNVAMGGTLGGTIDPAFVESSMEIDYVRVYQ